MGMVLDSFAVKYFDVSYYGYRAAKYVEELGGEIDIWEIGNEVNDGWLRQHEDQWSEEEATAVKDKIYRAYKAVSGTGGKTTLTLYFNDDG